MRARFERIVHKPQLAIDIKSSVIVKRGIQDRVNTSLKWVDMEVVKSEISDAILPRPLGTAPAASERISRTVISRMEGLPSIEVPSFKNFLCVAFVYSDRRLCSPSCCGFCFSAFPGR